jgi:hypothetical protein
MAMSGSITQRSPEISAECQDCVARMLDARARMLSLPISAAAQVLTGQTSRDHAEGRS